jgi:hypothetical protein
VSKKPLLSIIVATYKRPNKLKNKIDNLKKKYKKNLFELIIVQEKSDYQTIQFTRKLSFRFIKVINSRFNNVNHAVRDGCEKAKGYFVVIHGDDDYFDNNNFDYFIKILKKNKTCDWIIGYGKYVDYNGKIIRNFTNQIKKIFLQINNFNILRIINFLVCQSVFVNRKTLLEIGGYPIKYKFGSDYFLWLKLIRKKRKIILKNLSYCTYDYRTISGKFNLKKYLGFLRLINSENNSVILKFLAFVFLAIKFIIHINLYFYKKFFSKISIML